MMCVVQRDFVGGGEDYIRNELVDSSLFRNGDTLISQRFLRPATEMEIKTARLEGESAPATPEKKTSGLKAKIARRR